MIFNNQTKIIFKIPNGTLFFEVFENHEIKILSQIKTSILQMPIAKVKINAKTNLIQKLSFLEKYFKIEIYSMNNNNEFLLFKGMIQKYTIESDEQNSLCELNIIGISEFIKLAFYIPINIKNINNQKTFEEMMNEFIIDCKIDGNINMPDNIDTRWQMSYSQKIPALAIVKNFVRINNLSIRFLLNGNAKIKNRQLLPPQQTRFI